MSTVPHLAPALRVGSRVQYRIASGYVERGWIAATWRNDLGTLMARMEGGYRLSPVCAPFWAFDLLAY